MKKALWNVFLYACISFTTVTVLFAALGAFGLKTGLLSIEALQLFSVCFTLSATQEISNHIAWLDEKAVLRAVINMLILFLMGGGLYKWFPLSFFPLAFAGGVSIVAFLVVWVTVAVRLHRDAEDINEKLKEKRSEQK